MKLKTEKDKEVNALNAKLKMKLHIRLNKTNENFVILTKFQHFYTKIS